MSSSDSVRERVRRDYASLAMQPVNAENARPFAKGTVVQAAGYAESEVADLPKDTVANAFGCGNPVAFGEMQEGDVVLDLGSGAGIDLLLAARKVGPSGRVIGVDMTDEMISKARRSAAEAGLKNVEVRKGLIESLPVSDASVDWVISNCVVNLSPEKDRVFAEIARVLKPGGRMLVSDIVAERLTAEQEALLGPVSCCLAGAISESAYVAGLSAAGLTDVDVRDRIEYDKSALRALTSAESKVRAESACCSAESGTLDADTLRKLADTLAGKVKSIYIHARKPE